MEPIFSSKSNGTPTPLWARWSTWVAVFAFATLLGLMESAQAYIGMASRGRPMHWVNALYSAMPSWYVLALLIPAVVWLASRFRFDQPRWRLAVGVHILAALLFPVVHIGLTVLISEPLFGERLLLERLGLVVARLLTVYFVIDVFCYAGMLAAYYSADYYRKFQERALAASRLELQKSQLETSLAHSNLQALKMQLQPHFLFNTLNAISVLAMKGDEEAVVRMLGQLSDLLRSTLENTAQVVPLEEELEFLGRYLGIEQVRFQDRLTVETDVDDAALHVEVPSLLLQPIVENAIVHGISRQRGPGRIRIEAHCTDDSLQLAVKDTGPGLNGSGNGGGPTRRGGVGLANTRARLQQIYGGNFSFELVDAPEGGATARIRVPCRIPEGVLA